MASIVGSLASAPAISSVPKPKLSPSWSSGRSNCGGLMVECSSRPQKKATAHHMKTRPKKTQPWDVRRKGPTRYPPLPQLPPDWTLAESSTGNDSPPAPETADAA